MEPECGSNLPTVFKPEKNDSVTNDGIFYAIALNGAEHNHRSVNNYFSLKNEAVCICETVKPTCTSACEVASKVPHVIF